MRAAPMTDLQYPTLYYHTTTPQTRSLSRHFNSRQAAMDPQSLFGDLTVYFIYILFVATLGPLLFGFHLVCSVFHFTRHT